MQYSGMALLVFTVMSVTASLASAQGGPPPAAVLAERHVELEQWLARYAEWEAWAAKWSNRIAYNAAGGVVKKRPVRPTPPEWLWQDCQDVLAPDGKLGEACRILASWHDGLPRALSRQTAAVRADDVQKSSFVQRIHLSGGWVPAQLPAPKVYLVAGMQVGIVEVGRATLPGVGVGLMALSDGNGGYEWKPATVLSLGYRVATFPFPGIKRQSHLHINVARVTIHGMRNAPIGLDPSQNLVGFSLTFSKGR
jgi:hypothetical protein